jgi:hypothetical protein
MYRAKYEQVKKCRKNHHSEKPSEKIWIVPKPTGQPDHTIKEPEPHLVFRLGPHFPK